MKWEKDFALKREIINIIDRVQPHGVMLFEGKSETRLALEGYLNKADFKGCEDFMKKKEIPTCEYYFELMRRDDSYSWNL